MVVAAMEPILDIPAPEATDSETVAASLETAAVFGAKGDVAETLRWLQRATESASEQGDDARTLVLARTVATLSSRLNSAIEVDAHREPPPAPPPVEAAPAPDAQEATPFLLESRPRPPSPSSRPVDAGTPPPPPSSRAPSLRSVTPMPATPRPPASSAPSSAVVRPASHSPQPPKASNGTAPHASRPAPKSVTPSVLGAPPAAASSARSAPPLDAAGDAASPAGRRARQAARVSVTRSLTERGLYFVRVLDEGTPPPDDAFEALLVSNDPTQPLV
jgi:hypothetical protein